MENAPVSLGAFQIVAKMTEDEKANRAKFSFIFRYLKPYRRYIVQLFLGLVLGSLLQLIFPFLTQGIVDYGISNQNLGLFSPRMHQFSLIIFNFQLSTFN